MKIIILTISLISCVSIIYAQENIIELKKTQLPRYEFAFSVGNTSNISKLNKGWLDGFGSYTFSYHKRHKDWLWFGFYNNFIPVGGYYYYYLIISTAPSIRFSYINKPRVTIYSGCALGLGLDINLYSLGRTFQDLELILFYQLTAVGFSYGKNFFASGEIGYGFKGLGCVSLGYRW